MDVRIRPVGPARPAVPPRASRPVSGGVAGGAAAGAGAYRILGSRMLTADENHGMHNAFVRVVGPDGRGLNGVKVALMPEGSDQVIAVGATHDKDFPFAVDPNRPGPGDGDPRGDQAGWIDFPLNKGARYQVKIMGPDGSEIARGLTTTIWSTDDPAKDGTLQGDTPVEFTGKDPSDGSFMGHWSHLVVFQAGGGRDGAAIAPLSASELIAKQPVRRDAFVAPPAPASPRPSAEGVITVRPGDTLAALAQRHLGDARRWPELWRLNEAAIGPNPHLLRPGTRLVLPAGWVPAMPLPAFLQPRPAAAPTSAVPRLFTWLTPPAPPAAPSAPSLPAAPATPAEGRPLRLDEYPKANPVGAHGIPNFLKDPADIGFVLDLLEKAGARNTLLIVPFPNPTELRDLDKAFLAQAKARGITVQLRLGWDLKPGDDSLDPAALRRYTEQVAAVLGQPPYVQIGNEPNLYHEWRDHKSPDAAAAGRWWARYAAAVAEGGGLPGIPGLAAGAWNTPDGKAKQEFEFYATMVRTIAEVAPHTLDRAWTAAHPYHMYADAGHADYVEDLTWQLGRYDALNREIVGRSLPVLVTESGWVDGANARRFDPASEAQANDTARFKASLAHRPDWLVVGTADWLISNRHGGDQWKGIYGPNGEPSAFARVLEQRRGSWESLRDDVRR